VLEIVGREVDRGRRCAPVGCGTVTVGPPIGLGRGPMRIAVAAQARAFETPAETPSRSAPTHARSGHRPMGSPFVSS